jgi:hypothetical protein
MKWKDVWKSILVWLGIEDEEKPEPDPELEDYPIGDPEFLWKPGDHHNGKLVVLFPSDMPYKDIKKKWKFKEGTKFITDACVAKDREANKVIEDLDVRKTHISEPEEDVTDKLNPNGNRPHARGGESGGAYGDNIYAVALWESFDGSEKGVWSRHIPEGHGRWEGRDDPLRRTG